MTIDIESGDFIAFIGTSGSGKTTALRMINRMIESTEEKLPLTVKISKSLIRLSFVAVSVMSYNKSA